jgi:hypothetical protein
MIANLHFAKQIGRDIKGPLEAGNLERFGELMNTQWEHEKPRSSSMSNERINHLYDVATTNGALGANSPGPGVAGFSCSSARSELGCARLWLRRGSRGPNSDSISKGPRRSFNDPTAPRDFGRRHGNAARTGASHADGAVHRGTAGAIQGLLPLCGSAFFVRYGDSYLEGDSTAVQEAFGAAGKTGADDRLPQ